jgi:predicted permease
VSRFYDDLLIRLSALPGVTNAGITSQLPLSGPQALVPVFVEHAPPPPNTLPPVFPVTMTTAGYFRAMRITLVAGRLFGNPTDPTDANSIIVSRALAEAYWHDPTGRAAIGQRLRAISNRWSTIVGVVESVRDTSLVAEPAGQVYVPLSVGLPQTPDSLAPFTPSVASIALRTSGDPTAMGASVRAVVRSMDATVPVFSLEPLTNVVDRATARTRFVLIILTAAASITLLLGAIGLYGVVAYVVSLRTRELGLRLALGAEPRGVLGLVIRDGVTLAVVGVGAGLVAFAGVARFLNAFLFGVSAADPVTLSAVAATLLIVAGLASAVPAWRASRIDPLEALRAD